MSEAPDNATMPLIHTEAPAWAGYAADVALASCCRQLLLKYAMKRKVFLSFHYDEDSWRASQVRNMGVVEGERPCSPTEWEEVKRKGDESIKRWINSHIKETTCLVVLVGKETASRPWVRYEIRHAWEEGKGVVGIRIHNLKNQNGETSGYGTNPFETFSLNGKMLSEYVKCYNPRGDAYNWIKENLSDCIEEAISLRSNH